MADARPPRRRRCPLCGAPRDETYRPFCGRGCRDRDLNAWFGEDYRVPATTPPEPGEGVEEAGEARF